MAMRGCAGMLTPRSHTPGNRARAELRNDARTWHNNVKDEKSACPPFTKIRRTRDMSSWLSMSPGVPAAAG